MTSNQPAKRISGGDVERVIETLMGNIPDPTDDGNDILADILSASSASDLIGEANTLPSSQDLAKTTKGRTQFELLAVSEGWVKRTGVQTNDAGEEIETTYLIVPAVNMESSELIRFTSGAASVTAKLLMLAYHNGLPARVSFALSEKQTKRGYRPVNMNVLSVTS